MGIDSFSLTHIGWITDNLEEALECFKKLGIGPFRLFQPEYHEKFYMGKKGDFEMKVAIAPLGPIELELIQPLAGKSVYYDFLAKSGGGFHHLAYNVSDLSEALNMLRDLGMNVTMSGARKGVRFAYLQGESGPTFELIERRG